MGLALSWLIDCCNNHEYCHRLQPNSLPDRYLYVGRDRDPELRINTGSDTGYYATLSHCWGGNINLRLTTENLEALSRGIPLSSLPKNFQEAVHVCRALKIEYLWIDSLCIIQNSKSDWQEQGSKMADIYSNCLVCIAADAAKDSGGGFLRTPGRQHAANQAHELTTAGIANVYVRRPAIEAYNVCVSRLKYSCHTWSEPADGPSPLSSRGWVLQETLLSPRILHFTSDELMWQCQSIAQCECAPGYTDFVREGSSKPDTSVELWSLTWDTAMENFMARNLTFQTDRLDSLAGLAKRMKSKAQAEGIRTSYVAGLWTHTLRMDLHWKREVKEPDPNVFDNEPSEPSLEEPFNPSSRIDPYIAPTWSWASITGRVQPASKVGHWRENTLRYMQEELRDELELEPITTDYLPASVNAFGAAMQGSSLTLRGEIFDVVVSQYNKLKDDNWGAPEYIAHFVDVEDDVPNPDGDRDITFEGRHECFFDTDEDEEAVKMGQRNLLALNLSNYTTFILLEQLYRSGSTRVCKRVGIVSDFESEFGLDFDVTRAAIFQGWGKRRKIKIV
ncbi:uncharacterized protein CTRU02_210505 [Colletotrichum truncatum]|uniref:Uncharacterized protein n=1 Tax=Colletotrichum truncatum TaxID=5467 RepID=A0ACC3YP66_COLTU|nr:uncharacterized protein CTRU02_12705 [Colletotrichum truncatum]KAF6784176.1 hypothetical protein CTRU02_12705 [Colletotrichum truncatum]